jgi:hypothetical protein
MFCYRYRYLLELIVNLLFEDKQLVVHVKDPNEVGPLQVVLDEADHATAALIPSVAVARALAVIHLKIINTRMKYRGYRYYGQCFGFGNAVC